MKFIADGMLGRLTRWLRLLGHDVKYSTNMDDKQLIALAKKEKRILLTRDFPLYQQAISKGLDVFYVQGQTQAEKLAELAKRFDIKLEVDMTISRCPKCNAEVRPITKEKVAEKVEKNTFAHYSDFWICPRCKQIYWQGAHWTKISKMLNDANKSAKPTCRNVNSRTD